MRWHELIFSIELRHRNQRHLLCWLLWWIYVVFTIFVTGETAGFYHHQYGLTELGYVLYSLLVIIKSFLLLLTHLFFCYSVIYILLPSYLSKKNYWHLIIGVWLLCTLMIPVGYFLYSLAYPFVDKLFNLQLPKARGIVWASIDATLMNAIKVTLVVAAVTLLKRWWLKQKEKENLEKERINTELQLLKAQIHPAFLFSTLNNIILHAQQSSPKAPEMLIKLSDLLSYMLYECDAPKVKLEKEIGMIKEYMALEKIRQGERLDLTFQINGNLNGQLISPLLLLPFIDNSFSYCNNELVEQAWVNLDITVQDDSLSMKLINGIPGELVSETRNDGQSFANVKKRLELLYAEKHELKINAEQELLMVHLNLKLEHAIQEKHPTVESPKPYLNYAGI